MKAVINVKTLQTHADGDSDNFEFTCLAEYEFLDDAWVIKYEESDETELGEVFTTIKILDKYIEINRSGGFENALHIEEGVRHVSGYLGEFSPITLGTSGRSVKVDLDETGGEVRFVYSVDVNTGLDAVNDVKIVVRVS